MSDLAANGQDVSQSPPSLLINAQYVRDLSFENPRAPDSLMTGAGQPEVSIDVDIAARQINGEVYESALSLRVEAKQAGQVAFVVEVTYAAAVTIRNATQEMLAALLLVETPRLMFPFVRAIISDATREGGFPPLQINPIDFVELNRRKAEAQQRAAETAPPPTQN